MSQGRITRRSSRMVSSSNKTDAAGDSMEVNHSDEDDFQSSISLGRRNLRSSGRLVQKAPLVLEDNCSSTEVQARKPRAAKKNVYYFDTDDSMAGTLKRGAKEDSNRSASGSDDSSLASTSSSESEIVEVRRSKRILHSEGQYKEYISQDLIDDEANENDNSRSKLRRKKKEDDVDFNLSSMSEDADSEVEQDDHHRFRNPKSSSTGKRMKKRQKKVDAHQDYCRVCKDGGDLLCCENCPWTYHTDCLEPVLDAVPDGKWLCPRCSAKPVDGKPRRILSWRWKESEHDRQKYWNASHRMRKRMIRPVRQFFVHLEGRSYWDCQWVDENQLHFHHPTLLRHYLINEELEEVPTEDSPDYASNTTESDDPLEENFYKYGVVPEWLQVQRVINHGRQDGVKSYLVKWKELGYDQLSWEPENAEYPGLKEAINEYKERRSIFLGELTSKPKFIFSPPEKPLTDCRKKYESQPPLANKNLALHSYQLDGLNWLRFSWAEGTNTILADEMGLGKTIQAITFLNSLYKEGHCTGPFLISAPLSTLINWEREFALWAPELYVVTYVGYRDVRKIIRENELSFDENAVSGGLRASRLRGSVKFQVLLTSYEHISIDSSCLRSINWAVIIVDEGHRIKNDTSLFFGSLSQYPTNYRLVLTGTPLQNDLKELFFLLHFLCPDKFADLAAFENEFTDISKEEQVRKLHELLAPHMIRRLKADVLKDLPGKSEVIVGVDLSPTQRKYYKHVLTKNLDALNAKQGRKTNLLNILMDLRKCCNHPYLFSAASESAPLTADGSYQLGPMTKACGKLILLEKMLKNLKENGHRVLIFSQMTRLLDILEDFLTELSYRYERIDGNTRVNLRQEAIDRFNAPHSKQFVFLLSTRAGGLGINLATADTVIIYDSDWNPHNDIQALARAHRIGQKNNVMVYRLVTKDTVEEKIIQVANRKMMLTHLVVRAESNLSLTKQELENLIRFGSQNIFKDDKQDSNNYSDESITQLMDRSNKGTQQKESGANEYLKGFQVASYISHDGDVDSGNSQEKMEQEEGMSGKENMDPNYWKRLLAPRAIEYQKEQETFYGRGKRRRAEVTYENLDDNDNDNTANKSLKEADPDFPMTILVDHESDEDDDSDNEDMKTVDIKAAFNTQGVAAMTEPTVGDADA